MTRAEWRFVALIAALDLGGSAVAGLAAWVTYGDPNTGLIVGVLTAAEASVVAVIALVMHFRSSRRTQRRTGRKVMTGDVVPADAWKPDGWDDKPFNPHTPPPK